MKESTLKVRMLGDFMLEYNGKSFSIERNNATKVNQLLQILLYYNKGVIRLELLEFMFNDEIVTNPSNSLRALVFRLRKALTAAGLPDDEYVHISRGTYSWTKNIPLKIDARDFDDLATEALSIVDKNCKKSTLIAACGLYKGEFLPMVVGQEWCTSLQVMHRKKFSECARELCEIYIEEKDFKSLYDLSKKAADLYPYDQWQLYELQALIELGKHKEAMRLYEETEALMFNEMGVSISGQMGDLLNKMGNQFSYNSDAISTVQKNIEEIRRDEDGAFYCSFPVFTESYRYMKRVIRRSGQSAWLMLCTITDGKGYALETSDRLDTLSDELIGSISKSIRGGDMFTKYSDNQFLVFLLGITKEDCQVVEDRITGHMQKESRKRYLKYQLAPVNDKSIGTTGLEKDISEIVRGME